MAEKPKQDSEYSAAAIELGPYNGLITRKRSPLAIWANLLFRWLWSVLFIVAAYAVLLGYSAQDVLSKKEKGRFNALMTASLIALAMMSMSHLISCVTDLRWWILSRKPRSRQEIESLLHAHRLSQVISLALKSRRLSVIAALASWLILFVGSQAGYASIPLCYGLEKTHEKALLAPGNITIPDLERVQTARLVQSSKSTRAERYTANSYGLISLAFNQGSYSAWPRPGDLWYTDDPLIFCNDTVCSFVFLETNTWTLRNPDSLPIIATTDRSVAAVSSCTHHRVIQGGNGTSANITIETPTGNQVVPLPALGGLEQSTFMTNTETNSCGVGCSIVSVFEASATSPWYYNCTTAMTSVTSVSDARHELGRDLSQQASSAIALQGYSSTPDALGAVQAVIYPSASWFGVPLNGSSSDTELLLSRFAIGVVSVSALANSGITTEGMAPWIGNWVNVTNWAVIHLIFGLSAGLQLVIAAFATWLAHTVVVPSHGSVAEARILQPITGARSPVVEVLDGSRHDEYGDGDVQWILCNVYLGMGLYRVFMEPRHVLKPRKTR